jgi:alkanesulfonate monooxygenase SsuD/methylene tetrahydromethanopterin reductase-like flavin-dependent oxidoreductase (luciferase family)
VLVQLADGRGRVMGDDKGARTPPLTGPPAELAAQLRAFAAAGADHVQLVLDPITIESIEDMGEVLGLLDTTHR